jgi:hypothetical protein
MGHIFSDSVRWFLTLNAQEWLYMLLGTVAFGMLCMRGYGSRNGY